MKFNNKSENTQQRVIDKSSEFTNYRIITQSGKGWTKAYDEESKIY